MAWSAFPTDARRYVGIAALLTIAYAIIAAALYAGRDFDDRGPLSYYASGAGPTPAGIVTAESALGGCFPDRVGTTYRYRVIAGQVRERWYFSCYEIPDETGPTSARVVDARAAPVTDVALLKEAGVWPWVGVITTGDALVIGFVVMIALPVFGWRYYRKARPGPAPRLSRRWWQHPAVAWVLVFVPGFGWIALALMRSISRARKVRIFMQAMLTFTGVVVATMLASAVSVKDPWGIPVTGLLMAGFLLSTLGGWHWLADHDFAYPDRPPAPRIGRAPRLTDPTPQPAPHPPQPAPLYSLPAPLIDEPPPPNPHPIDVAIREFRASARLRSITSRVIRGVAITLAAVLASLLVLIISDEFTASEPESPTLRFDGALLLIIAFYVAFVIPGVVAAILSLPLILGWRDPARILVLRPFNRADHSRSLRGLVRREVVGYGHVYTLADTAIKIRWYVTIPVLLGQLGFLSFRLRQIRDSRELEQLAHALIQVRRRNLNWAVAHSKLFAVRCTDTLWQQAVTHVARTCDAVLIDVTDLTEGLAWELELLQGLGRLDDCIFLALHGFEASARSMLTHQLGRTVRLLTFDRAGRLIAPREFRSALAAIIFRTTGRPADLITVPDPPGGRGNQ